MPNPESAPSVVISRISERRRQQAVSTLAAADTAASNEYPVWNRARVSRSTVARPCQGVSFWRIISSSRRAVDGQWTRRRSSPTS